MEVTQVVADADFAGEVLRQARARIAAGELTGASLARRSGVSQPQVSNWLVGRRRLTSRSLELVVAALRGRVSVEWGSDMVLSDPAVVAAIWPRMTAWDVSVHLGRAQAELEIVSATIRLLEALVVICRDRERAARAAEIARDEAAAALPAGERRPRKRPRKAAVCCGQPEGPTPAAA